MGDDWQGVKVLVRVRPLLDRESAKSATLLRNEAKTGTIYVQQPTANTTHKFAFDGILNEEANQAEVFAASNMEKLLAAAMDGYNASILAYGQTGSGKTYSMDGMEYKVVTANNTKGVVGGKKPRQLVLKTPSLENEGVCFRALRRLYELKQGRDEVHANSDDVHQQKLTYSIKVSFLQVYNERVYDMLSSTAANSSNKKAQKDAGLRVRWNKGSGFFVENLFKFDCPQVAEAIGYFVNGLKNRTVASHKFNRSSSRSHSIFTVYVDLLSGASELIQRGKISFVDLAGSERVSMTGNTGALLQQSISINKSLFVLRKVIDALAATQRKKSRGGGGGRKRKQKGKNTSTKPHIPFRDSVLTRLLKDSLGGNCRTLMLACLCPQDDMVEENLSTLNYAARTKTIKNKAKVNQDAKTALILRLRAEIKQLKAMLGRNTQLQSMTQGMEHDLATAVAATPAAPLEHKVEVQTQAKSPMSYSRVHDRVLSEKFVRSIELMKSVIADNNSLQESYQEIATQVEEYEYDNETLNTENNELRNRISFLENILVEAQAMPVTRANAAAAAATATPESKDEDDDEEEDTEDSVAQKLFKSEQENSALRQALYTNEQELKRCLALLAESTRRPRTSRRKAGR